MTARPIRRVNAAMDERIGTQKFLKQALDHIFPDNWSFMLGEVAFYCFIILVLTGVYLAFFFDPSDATVVYHGSYQPLQGQSMTSAYESVVQISLHVRAGLLIRQVHHWAADVFIAAIVCHLARIFFTGAFRKPREINWMIGVTLLLLSILNGFTGYSLPGDLMSGLGLRIGYSIAEAVPIIGNWVAYLFFGGQFPAQQIEHRLFIMHVFVVPVLIFALLGIHLALIWRQKHTQFPGTGRTEKRLVGSQLWPTYAFRSIALMCAVAGMLFVLGGLVQINPIWEYGPYHPYLASSFAQPDWYTGWMEGSLRLFPPIRIDVFGWTISELFWSGVVIPGGTFAVMWAYPFLERWWTGDHLSHNLLDRPRDRPGRTALGVAIFTFYTVLTVAGAQDVFGFYMNLQQVPFTFAMRGLVIGLPIVTGLITWRVCRDLRGVKVAPTEAPEGSAESGIPPLRAYLPGRVAWQGEEGRGEPAVTAGGDGNGTTRAAEAPGVGAALGRVASRLSRRSGSGEPPGPQSGGEWP